MLYIGQLKFFFVVSTPGSSRQAHRWGLKEGKLSRDNGKICVVRTVDNFGATRLCIEAFEYFTPEIPEVSLKCAFVSLERITSAILILD